MKHKAEKMTSGLSLSNGLLTPWEENPRYSEKILVRAIIIVENTYPPMLNLLNRGIPYNL